MSRLSRSRAGHAVADVFEVADFGAAGPGFYRRRHFKRLLPARLVHADWNLVVGADLAAGVEHVLHPASEFRAAPCGNAIIVGSSGLQNYFSRTCAPFQDRSARLTSAPPACPPEANHSGGSLQPGAPLPRRRERDACGSPASCVRARRHSTRRCPRSPCRNAWPRRIPRIRHEKNVGSLPELPRRLAVGERLQAFALLRRGGDIVLSFARHLNRLYPT